MLNLVKDVIWCSAEEGFPCNGFLKVDSVKADPGFGLLLLVHIFYGDKAVDLVVAWSTDFSTPLTCISSIVALMQFLMYWYRSGRDVS